MKMLSYLTCCLFWQGQEQVQGQGRKGFYFMQISKAVQNPTNCLFINFSSCYFWRSCGGHARMAVMQIPPLPHAPSPYAVRSTVGVGVRERKQGTVKLCRTSDFAKNYKLVRPYRHPHTPGSVHSWSQVF